MSLRSIGTPTAVFGTGEVSLLQKEVVLEPIIHEPLMDYQGNVSVVVRKGVKATERRTTYASDFVDTQGLTGDEIKVTVTASQDDFQKIVRETQTFTNG